MLEMDFFLFFGNYLLDIDFSGFEIEFSGVRD